ncbi:hypothetical protein C2S51_019551 [Perilla frutescens var. frutescens]|nr:hypothetical protein C2S51_019551 [Perilla frutescens var. frutescens]
MGLLSHKVKGSDLEEGDHVYVYRVAGAYSHHGIYVGNGMVVHVSVDSCISSSNCSASCSSSSGEYCCGFRRAENAVTMTCLDCFLKKGWLCRYKYGVSTGAFIAKVRAGTCTMAESDASEAVIHRAMYLLENGFGDYHLLRYNCEVFALYCKTERLIFYTQRSSTLRSCGQATSAFIVPSTAILSAINVPLAVGAAVVMHTWLKYANDIGVRKVKEDNWRGGVHKVRVEDLEEFRRKYSR